MNMTYREKININVRVCDISGQMRPSGLLWLFQDASEVLTERRGVGPRTMEQRGLNWIVARLGCECERLPVCEETVEMIAWADKPRMGIYPWQYQIRDAQGHTFVRGCALWVIFDSETRSMLSPNIPRLDLEEREPPDESFPWPKTLKLPKEMENQTIHRVSYRDCDLNGHANNACYLDWLCDLPEMDFHRAHSLKRLAIDYRAEAKPQEDVTLSWAMDGTTLLCRGEGKFLCRMDFE